MGCFDRVMFPCPNCGALMEAQSKGSSCLMRNFHADSVPLDVAGGIMEDRLTCDGRDTRAVSSKGDKPGCGAVYRVNGPRVSMQLTEESGDSDEDARHYD